MKKFLSMFLFLAVAVSHSAALVVNPIGGIPPSENVVYSQYYESGSAQNYTWRWRTAGDPDADPAVLSDRRDIGQLFSLEGPTSISTIGIYLPSASQNSEPRPFTLSIIKASDLNPGGWVDGNSTITVLETLNGALQSIGSGGYLQFSFEDSPVFLDAIENGSSYGFLLAYDGAIPVGSGSDTGNSILFRSVPSAEHRAFTILYNNSTSSPVITVQHPNVFVDRGLDFYVQGAAIPEVETAVAMAGGLLLLIVFVRRFKKS